MSQSLDIATIDQPSAELLALDSRQLRQELVRSLSLSVEHLVRAAIIVRILEERGETVEDEANQSLVSWLRRIAYGQLAPEAVIRFAGKPGMVNSISSLPLPDQRLVASGKPVALVVRRENNTFDERMVDPLYLSRSQFSQVFARGRIRTAAEQILFLESEPAEVEPSKPKKVGKLRPDPKRGGIVIGKTFAPVADILGALAQLHPGLPPDTDEEPVQVAVKLSPIEHKRLKMATVRANTSIQTLLYRALITSGLLAQTDDE